MTGFHKSVLYQEVLESLKVKPGEVYIDATLGGGGHTKGILEGGGRVLGVDLDPEALEHIRGFVKSNNLLIEQGNFRSIDEIARKSKVGEVAGILFDLGVSSYQLDSKDRGFGFKHSAHLDMRMDPKLKVTAADLIAGLNEGELYELFFKFGEERYARRIARAIVASRSQKTIKTTEQLANLVESAVGRSHSKIHPATRTFMALRIAVNDELNNLREALPKAENLLKVRGRLVVISFHSLEDKIVKDFINQSKHLKAISKKPITPTPYEIDENPRSRSAKLRVAEKI